MSDARRTVAAVATLFAGIVIGGLGFIKFLREAASANNTLMLTIASRQASGTMGGAEISGAAPVALTMLAPLAFVIATPLGWLSAYLVVTGLVRSLASVVRDPVGDPLLAAARALVVRRRDRRRVANEVAAYAALAGPDVADLIAEGERYGLADADLVVVASRPKPEWTPGTVLECGDRWLRVGPAVERTLPMGLRTLYPLVEAPGTEVFRRVLRYDLPARVE